MPIIWRSLFMNSLRDSKLVLPALVVSLGINLLVAGVLLGRALNPAVPPPPMAWAVRDLDEQTARRLRPMLRERMGEVRPLRSEMRNAMRDFAEVVEREPFDAQAAARALATLRTGSARYQEVLHRNMLSILEGLAPEERLAVVRMLLHRGARRPERPARAAPPAAPPADAASTRAASPGATGLEPGAERRGE